MRIVDTSIGFQSVFIDGQFNLDKWEIYIDKWVPGAKELCLNDMKECIDSGYSWNENYLPILNAVYANNEKRKETVHRGRSHDL